MSDDVRTPTREAAPGPVTIIPPRAEAGRPERTIIVLLAIVTALLAAMVVGLGLAAWWVAQQYAAVQAAARPEVAGVRADLEAAIATAQALSRDAIARQAALGADLGAQAARMQGVHGDLERRRAAFGPIPKDPFGKADYAIGLSLLAVDEAMLINRHVAATQRALAKNLAPTPAQEALMQALPDRPRAK